MEASDEETLFDVTTELDEVARTELLVERTRELEDAEEDRELLVDEIPELDALGRAREVLIVDTTEDELEVEKPPTDVELLSELNTLDDSSRLEDVEGTTTEEVDSPDEVVVDSVSEVVVVLTPGSELDVELENALELDAAVEEAESDRLCEVERLLLDELDPMPLEEVDDPDELAVDSESEVLVILDPASELDIELEIALEPSVAVEDAVCDVERLLLDELDPMPLEEVEPPRVMLVEEGAVEVCDEL